MLLSLSSSSPGNQPIISQITGSVDADWVNLKDITATGGATFKATNSIDFGNNTGWNIISPPSEKFYWVRHGGNWSDFFTYWYSTSGGSLDKPRMHNILDSVYFDANSFSSVGQTVTLDVEANMANMDWRGVTNEPT